MMFKKRQQQRQQQKNTSISALNGWSFLLFSRIIDRDFEDYNCLESKKKRLTQKAQTEGEIEWKRKHKCLMSIRAISWKLQMKTKSLNESKNRCTCLLIQLWYGENLWFFS